MQFVTAESNKKTVELTWCFPVESKWSAAVTLFYFTRGLFIATILHTKRIHWYVLTNISVALDTVRPVQRCLGWQHLWATNYKKICNTVTTFTETSSCRVYDILANLFFFVTNLMEHSVMVVKNVIGLRRQNTLDRL